MVDFTPPDLAELDALLDASKGGIFTRATASWALKAAELAGTTHQIGVWCARRPGAVEGICLTDQSHATIVRLGGSLGAARLASQLTGGLLPGGAALRSLAGRPAAVRAVRRALRPAWVGADLSERRYLLLTLAGRSASALADPLVRPARADELSLVIDASTKAAAGSGGPGGEAGEPLALVSRYLATADSVSRGRRLIKLDRGEVVFTAEISPAGSDLCLVNGVWMAPSHRGSGGSESAMASVVELARRSARTVALFVDARNEPARRCYRRVGFSGAGSLLHVRLPGH